MKMWEGRFKKKLNSAADSYNKSIYFDKSLYSYDITGSISHAEMLGKTGIIDIEESKKIIDCLNDILKDINEGRLTVNDNAEDIHMFVEEELTKRIGDSGKRLHTARSRNDQVALDFRLYIKDHLKTTKSLLLTLLSVISEIAGDNVNTIMPGYTHLQRAQPISFAHWILAYSEMFKRDISRLDDAYKRTDSLPLGACALAGTTYPIDREMTANKLGFSSVTANSIDSVSDRDFALESLFDLSVIMMHLSRFSEEIILYSSSEFAFIDLDDSFSTGSSIMPQKKNPDIAELARGKTGRVYGSLVSLLTVMKGLPLAYNKDMQEDKEAVFDAFDTVESTVSVFTGMLKTITVNKDNLYRSAGLGFINATDCADYLVRKGLPFRTAYKITGGLIAYCIDNNKAIADLSTDEFKQFSEYFEDDVYDSVSLETCLNNRKSYGGPSPENVSKQIELLNAYIKTEADN